MMTITNLRPHEKNDLPELIDVYASITSIKVTIQQLHLYLKHSNNRTPTEITQTIRKSPTSRRIFNCRNKANIIFKKMNPKPQQSNQKTIFGVMHQYHLCDRNGSLLIQYNKNCSKKDLTE